MTSFIDLDVFVRTVEGGIFSTAVRSLDITPAAAVRTARRCRSASGYYSAFYSSAVRSGWRITWSECWLTG